MRKLSGALFGAFLACTFAASNGSQSLAAQAQPFMEDSEAFLNSRWTKSASILGESGATLHPPAASRAVVNEGVNTFNRIDDPYDYEQGVFRYDEAILRFDRHGTVRYAFFRTGHTIDDDFATLDADRLMVVMKSTGCSCDPVRWEKRPAYDRTRHVVTWMVRERWINEGTFGDTAYADIYMRAGHEHLEATTRASNPATTWAELQAGIAALSVPVGNRYEDVQLSDPSDGPHIAELTSIDAAPAPVSDATPASEPVTTPIPEPVTTPAPVPATTATVSPFATPTPVPVATSSPVPIATATPGSAASQTPLPVTTSSPGTVPTPEMTVSPVPIGTATRLN